MTDDVKKALGITGDYLDDTLNFYIEEVTDFARNAGVKSEDISVGLVARGVSDLWNYGAGEGKLSEYFIQRCKQLSLR
jgi:hypothetical protein